MKQENLFDVFTPEELSAKEFEAFYVDLYNDIPIIKQKNNTIITGARGCGKSMLIRSFLPEYLMRGGTAFADLRYWAISLSVFRTSLSVTDVQALTNRHAPHLISESIMILHILETIFDSLSKINGVRFVKEEYESFFTDIYLDLLDDSGYINSSDINPNFDSAYSFFRSLKKHIGKLRSKFIIYLSKLVLNIDFKVDDYSFDLPLFNYLRFMMPLFDELKPLIGFPQEKPVYLFIDDADNLTLEQTQVLNMWISYRTQPKICIKVVTLIDSYKTYRTPWDRFIESPHDYLSVNISDLYTSGVGSFQGKATYKKKAIDILRKRLKYGGIMSSPEAFLPTDPEQDRKIKNEQNRIRKDYPNKGRGYRISDDVRRYALPDYVLSLGFNSKNRNTFIYAGLDSIIHLSSGIIRNYLRALASMYSKVLAFEEDVVSIPPKIQNETMRELADSVLYKEMLRTDYFSNELQPLKDPETDIGMLQNLICAMGQAFFAILVTPERAERMVFSIALSNVPDADISRILRYGVKLGLMHESRIGNKMGTGKTFLYVLNRVIAPIFNLVPYGFQGYLYITNDAIREAFRTGKSLKGLGETDETDVYQLSLYDFWED